MTYGDETGFDDGLYTVKDDFGFSQADYAEAVPGTYEARYWQSEAGQAELAEALDPKSQYFNTLLEAGYSLVTSMDFTQGILSGQFPEYTEDPVLNERIDGIGDIAYSIADLAVTHGWSPVAAGGLVDSIFEPGVDLLHGSVGTPLDPGDTFLDELFTTIG